MAISTMSGSPGARRTRDETETLPKKKYRLSVDTAHTDISTTTDLFALQVGDLLQELEQQAESNVQKATGLLKLLREAILQLPAREPLLPREAESQLKKTTGICTPFPSSPPKDTKYTLQYSKPTAINVVGSAANGTLVARDGEIVADMVVVMPPDIFQEKDYRKHRYFHKKAYYTACVAAGLQSGETQGLSCSFSSQNGNPLQPCILVKQKDNAAIGVKILCIAPSSVFPAEKILPWSTSLHNEADSTASGKSTTSKTPFYHSTIRAEMLSLKYLSLIHKISKESSSLRKASLLFSVWLRQRGLGTNVLQGGFGAFEAQTLMALMLDSDSANGAHSVFRTRYDAIQLFKATLILLSSKDFVSSPVLYNYSNNGTTLSKSSQPLQNGSQDLLDGTTACFFDGINMHNLFFKISPWAMARLRREAEITIKCLSGDDNDRFDHCFLSRLDTSSLRHDQVLEADLHQFPDWNKSDGGSTEVHLDFSNRLYQTLKRALGDRVREISFDINSGGSWDVNRTKPRSNQSMQLKFVFDAQNATRLQDLGPSADEKDAAAAFRQFWGTKAELRRFKDGSIQETVTWNGQASEPITTQIIRYTLERHHNEGNSVLLQELGSSFQQQLPQTKQSQTLAPFENMLQAFQDLEKTIRGLKMPLDIRQISPASSGLRYCMLDLDSKAGSQPLQVVVQFESSGQWPDDLSAIQQVKIAFLQKLGDLLAQQGSVSQARVGLGQSENKLFCRPFLEVAGVYTFHIIIYHDRELHLLKSKLPSSMDERASIVTELSYHNQTFLRASLHTQRVRDLCTKHPLLSQSIRLFKNWCRSHLLLPHFCEEALELLVIYTFTQPAPYAVPSSIRTAFLRTISMLAKWDWHNTPLFVPLNDDIENSGISEELDTHFQAWRKIDPSQSRVAMIIGSTIDPSGTAWTETKPSKMVAARLTSIAKITHAAITQHDLNLDPKLLFTHSYKDYDFVLHLNTDLVASLQRSGSSAFLIENYVHELQRVFGDTVVWFHAGEKIQLIAGLWNPLVQSKRWKVNLGYSTVPLRPTAVDIENDGSQRAEIKSNSEAMINEMVRLGSDLVVRVSRKGEAV